MKGLAITGVVAGHAGIETVIETFVNYWHLPVFFFVSGYFLKQKHIDNWKGYIASRFRRLIIPFLLAAIIALLLHNSLLDLNVIDGRYYDQTEIKQELKHMLLLTSNEQLIGAMWFLPALFFVSVIGLTITKYINSSISTIYWG